MLSEEEIRSIAGRCSSALINANSTERALIVENAIREAIMKSSRRFPPIEPNAGCL